MGVDIGGRGTAVDEFRHEAVLYAGPAGLEQTVVPFVREGVRQGEAVLVALIDEHLDVVREALGGDADAVEMLDMAAVGLNPARIIPAWRHFLVAADGRAARGVGEPVWAGRRPAELDECRLHEGLLNTAFDHGPAWQLLCPYDVDALPDEVIEDARRTHPGVRGDHVPSAYEQGDPAIRFTEPLPPPPALTQSWRFVHGDLPWLRAEVAAAAGRRGLSLDRIDDLVLAMHELVANSLVHGGGTGMLSVWSEPGAFVVDIRDKGTIDNPLVGRELIPAGADSGRGIWMAHQLCDLVQVRSGPTGTTIRLRAWTD